MTRKTKVVVLYGGCSGEHEISLQSAASVVKNLDRSQFEIIPIGIDKKGSWRRIPLADVEIAGLKSLPLPLTAPKVYLAPGTSDGRAELRAESDTSYVESVDIVFPVMHGPLCEDGSIQGLFEVCDVAYVGAGVLGSAIGMDKDVAKRLARMAGIPVVPSQCIRSWQWNFMSERDRQQIVEDLGLPIFVKPVNMGSSVGVTKVTELSQLTSAIANAFLYDEKVLLEKGIAAREVEVAVLESISTSEPAKASICGEIVPQHEFYSYKAKYLDENGAALKIPAPLDEESAKKIQNYAIQAFTVLECSGLARVDFFVDRDDQKIYLNEINTMPGFTQISMYPKLWEASGLSYQTLLTQLVELGLARHQRRKQISREFIET